jgi:lipoprotein-anchoring transpeptidase ErfK/SrfK
MRGILTVLTLVAGVMLLAPVGRDVAHGATVSSAKQQNSTTNFNNKRSPKAKEARKKRNCNGFLDCLFSGNTHRASLGGGFGRRSFKQVVAFDDARYAPGSVIVRTSERALYYVLPDGEAVRYRVGVGREGFQWSGSSRIVAKEEWPSWTPPAQMIAREAAKGIKIPHYMEGGPRNPLGARALYIGGTLYRIHGTNNARSIGGAVSSGCIRMLNGDVIDLYERVRVGAPVHVHH